MSTLLFIISGILALPLLFYVPLEQPSRVCLIDEQQSTIEVADYIGQPQPYVQLQASDGEVLLAEKTYKLPIALINAGQNCFTQPLYLLHDEQGYQWIDTDANVLYEVYWFDNGPDYPSDGVFRFQQNGNIGYADAKTFDIIIPAQFKAALPFRQGKAKVSYQGEMAINDVEHHAWQAAKFFTIDKQGRRLDD